jgi:hypothetical protein
VELFLVLVVVLAELLRKQEKLEILRACLLNPQDSVKSTSRKLKTLVDGEEEDYCCGSGCGGEVMSSSATLS